MLPFRSSSVIAAKMLDTRPKIVGQKLNVLSVEKAKQPKCANCKGPHAANHKGCPAYKKGIPSP